MQNVFPRGRQNHGGEFRGKLPRIIRRKSRNFSTSFNALAGESYFILRSKRVSRELSTTTRLIKVDLRGRSLVNHEGKQGPSAANGITRVLRLRWPFSIVCSATREFVSIDHVKAVPRCVTKRGQTVYASYKFSIRSCVSINFIRTRYCPPLFRILITYLGKMNFSWVLNN